MGSKRKNRRRRPPTPRGKFPFGPRHDGRSFIQTSSMAQSPAVYHPSARINWRLAKEWNITKPRKKGN